MRLQFTVAIRVNQEDKIVHQKNGNLVRMGAVLATSSFAQDHDWDRNAIRHVLLISIDGMHPVDYLNCKNGIAGVNGGAPYCPNLADLGTTGVNYLYGSTTLPSDSFPGLMGLVSGGTPRTVGAF